MPRRSPLSPLTLSLALLLAACNQGGDAKKTDGKVDPKPDVKVAAPTEDTKRDPGTSLDKAVVAIDLAGPIPPEASAIELFTAELAGPAGCTVLVFTMIPDAGRARAAAGFDLVLDTLAVDALQ